MPYPKDHTVVNLTDNPVDRHLLVFMDGTWNDENGRANDGAVTNIYKMFSSLTGSHDSSNVPHTKTTSKHVGLYFRGVGNDEENIQAIGYYQGAFGAGEKNIRDHAYASICKHYRPGDKVSIFGFSRGASSARLLATKLEKYGLPKEITLNYKRKKNPSSGEMEWMFSHYKAKEEKTQPLGVDFLGIFDTVGAFGIPVKIGPLNFQKINLFRDLTLASNIERAVHLVAVDESREPFIPTLTNYSNKVDEVWMPGVHADVGGGYHDCMLGNISLEYMVRKFKGAIQGPEVKFKQSLDKFIDYDLGADDFVLHYHGDGIKKYARELEVKEKSKKTSVLPVKIHHSVLDLQNRDNIFYSERLNSFSTRTPIRYDPTNFKSLASNYTKVT